MGTGRTHPRFQRPVPIPPLALAVGASGFANAGIPPCRGTKVAGDAPLTTATNQSPSCGIDATITGDNATW